MNEPSGELQYLVPQEQEEPPVTPPPISTTHGTSSGNPLSPTSPSTKVSSGSGSIHGKSENQNSTKNKTSITIGGTSLLTTPHSGGGGHPTRLLYVNEKLSRGPSLLSEHSVRHTSKPSTSNTSSASARILKKAEMPVQHHVFLSDITDVRNMEKDLLRLLEDFHSGKLRAFGKDCSMEQMNSIREQQERLARLHFDLCAQQELFTPLSEDGLKASKEHMGKLMTSLEQLSVSIERLHSDGSGGGHLGGGPSGNAEEAASSSSSTMPPQTPQQQKWL